MRTKPKPYVSVKSPWAPSAESKESDRSEPTLHCPVCTQPLKLRVHRTRVEEIRNYRCTNRSCKVVERMRRPIKCSDGIMTIYPQPDNNPHTRLIIRMPLQFNLDVSYLDAPTEPWRNGEDK